MDCEAKKLSVTESVNLVSFAESKRAYRGRSPVSREGEKSAEAIVSAMGWRRAELLSKAAKITICKSHERSENNGTRHSDNSKGRRSVSHLMAASSGGTS